MRFLVLSKKKIPEKRNVLEFLISNLLVIISIIIISF